MSQRNFYDILGVPLTATPEQIRAAHRAQSPISSDTADDRRGDPSFFTLIQEAYETLSVPDYRRRYDNKQAAAHSEAIPRSSRRPPKSPCGACKKPVYASQLILYLGRYMCKACFDRKQARDAKRPRLTGAAELRWRLKRLGVWAQSHIATIAIIVLALGAAGARLAWVGHHARSAPASAAPTTSGASTASNPPEGPPVDSSETADIGPTNPSGK